ncbi:ABC transporter permease [Paenibacillus humicola]|uniref:ABC transporter permease n=1 Tax=Paenibacillus humicola TaxID=3110540 RepID=UPI00237BF174|nr:ABC transporter permease [Paenibacillus humicola]
MSTAQSIAGVQTIPERKITRGSLAWRRFSKNRLAVVGLVWVAIVLVIAVIGPLIAPYGYEQANYIHANEAPSWSFPFGTDSLGHDMFSEIIYSIRFACVIAIGATAVAFVIGAVLGLWAGFAGRVTDNIIMRLVDLMFAFPSYFLNLILVVSLGRGLFPIFLSIGITQWAGHARLIRGLVLTLKNGEMVEAARSLGATRFHIARHYLLPNIIGSVIVSLSFSLPTAMTLDAALSVVGLGLQPPMPSFGNLMTAGGQNILGFPWMLYFPAGVFALTLLSFLFVGNGLQLALNPKGDA